MTQPETSEQGELTVVGLGYIGLPTAALFAAEGMVVTGVDVDRSVVESVNAGGSHIVEPGLDNLVAEVVRAGRLSATSIPAPAKNFIIAVPTPLSENKTPQLAHVEDSIRTIAPLLRADSLIILESTSPVGTTESIASSLAEMRQDLKFGDGGVAVAYCPERVLPGQILAELKSNDRLIGGLTEACTQRAIDLYEGVVDGVCHPTTSRVAEMAKLAENSYRDLNIAFANELSRIAQDVKVDVREMIALANRHPRVNILSPGPGVGGHCIAVDPWFLAEASPEARLVTLARIINDEQPSRVVSEVVDAVARSNATSVACLGLAYKPDVDDLRESPAAQIVRELSDHCDVDLLVVEPYVKELPSELHSSRTHLVSLEEGLEADVIVGLVRHTQFQSVATRISADARLVDPAGVFVRDR